MSIRPDDSRPDSQDFLGGGASLNVRVPSHCKLAGIKPSLEIMTCEEETRVSKVLRLTCETDDQHVPASSVEVIGHSEGGNT